MQPTSIVIGLVLGLVLGSVIAWLVASRNAAGAIARASSAEQRVAALDAERQATAATLATAQAEAAAATARLEEATSGRAADQERLQGLFAQLSQDALSHNTEHFMALAATTLNQNQQQAAADLSNRQVAIKELLDPLGKQLEQYQALVTAVEQNRVGAYAQLVERVTELKDAQGKLEQETRNLVQALRAPQTRGRWGELQLRRVVELAGMVDKVDFVEQSSTDSGDGKLRPDMVVHLPGGGTIVVDSKVPLQAFLEANEATTEAERKAALIRHAQQLRTHITQLADKAYWKQQDSTPELVVCFIPGEPLANAAFEQDPGLMEYALSRQVIPATPTNLITLLKTIQHNWHYDDIEEKAEKIGKLGAELYERLRVVGSHMAKMHKSLTKTVDAFNDMVGSVETRLVVTARELAAEQLIAKRSEALPSSVQVDRLPRQVQAPELLPFSSEERLDDAGELSDGSS